VAGRFRIGDRVRLRPGAAVGRLRAYKGVVGTVIDTVELPSQIRRVTVSFTPNYLKSLEDRMNHCSNWRPQLVRDREASRRSRAVELRQRQTSSNGAWCQTRRPTRPGRICMPGQRPWPSSSRSPSPSASAAASSRPNSSASAGRSIGEPKGRLSAIGMADGPRCSSPASGMPGTSRRPTPDPDLRHHHGAGE
jgi:hypothetical protein